MDAATIAASRRGVGTIDADGRAAYVVLDGVRVSSGVPAGGGTTEEVGTAPVSNVPSKLPTALPLVTRSAELANSTNRQRREKVRSMMSDAWNDYKLHAWGANELRPVTKVGHSQQIFGSVQGATIVDALDTLLLMNMTREAADAREWIADHLHFDIDAPVSTFEVCIRYLGGLLSAYALTGDEMYKAKAVEIGDRLLPAFNTNTGIPWSSLNLRSGSGTAWGWAPGGCAILSELGTMSMEFEYLSR